MLELDTLVVNQIETDSTMISLMGIAAGDTRVYAWYPATDIEYVVGQKEVCIVYRNSLGGRPFNWSYPSQMPDMLYFFRVLSISQLKLRQVSERLIELFDQQSLISTNWAVKWIELVGYADGMNEGSPTKPIMSKNVSFTFSVTVRRGT